MKKSFIAVVAVFAVVIILGALSALFTDIGDYRFTDGLTVTVTNDALRQDEFDEYVKSVENYFTSHGLAYQSKQFITNEFEEITSVLYDIYGLEEEQKTSLTTFLETEEYITYTFSDIEGKIQIKAVIFAAVGAALVLIVQFLYYLLIHKKQEGLRYGLAATASTFFALLAAVAFSFILAFLGIKYTPVTTSAVLLVLLLSVFINAVLFEKVKYNTVTQKLTFEKAKEAALEYAKKYFVIFFAPVAVVALIVTIAFMPALLSFGLTLLFGVICLFVLALYLTLQLWITKDTL